MNNRRLQGSQWEKLAESFLHKRGLKTLERNYHSRFGEIDLIMMDRHTLVFTEVRYRRDSAYGSGAESVTFTKQKRITRAAQRFLQLHQHHASLACRFDVVSIGNEEGRVILNWIRNAFDAV
ncbi:MAG: YraN family protein [Proteobacteria bacterium]|nr:YraN family protein [Pseudomonadota bacterium]